MEDKMTDLETKFSFQENLLAELNDALSSQQAQISSLQHELTIVKQHLKELLQSGVKSEHYELGDEKPPHY